MSLDLCNKYIAGEIRRDIAENLVHLSRFRKKFSGRLEFADSEPFHITVRASESGYDGAELIVLLSSPFFRPEDYAKLSEALEKSLASAGRCEKNIRSFSMKLPEKAMRIREAVFSTTEDIDVENSEGRICGAVRVPCPPAVPIAASGEIIDRNCINIFKSYGISTVNVVK